MKKEVIITEIIFGLFFLIMAVAIAQTTYEWRETLVPLSQYDRDLLESFPQVNQVVLTDYGSTLLEVDVDLFDEDNPNINATLVIWNRLEGYWKNLYSSNLKGVPAYNSLNNPFSCPRDVVTGDISGLYLVNGVVTVDVNDTQGRCPQ